MVVISSEPVEELAMKGCCCFHEDSSLTVINVSSVQGCSANWDRHQTEECSPDSVLGIEWKIQFHSCRLSMRSVVGDRVTTLLRVWLADKVWAWFSVILCEFSAGKTEGYAGLFKSWDKEMQPTLKKKKYSPAAEERIKMYMKSK